MYDPRSIKEDQVQSMLDHAKACYPQESCGLIVEGSYVPVDNIHQEPTEGFLMRPQDYVIHGPVSAVVHSHIHPKHPRHPSASDMEGQINSAVPWGIIHTDGQDAARPLWWGDFRLADPMIGDEFVHGVTDCYHAIRKFYWQERGVTLLDFARDFQWWSDGKNLYDEGFALAGFKEIDIRDIQHGDVVLGRVRSPVTNHGGVYMRGDLLYHHLEDRLSRREPIHPWMRYVKKVLRYEP